MKCLITDKTLKSLKTLQENLEEGLITKKSAALSLKYAIEDIEAMEFTVLHDGLSKTNGPNETVHIFVATYETGV